MLKCTINGKEVEVKEGSTIIDAYKQNHIDIAHYCWHPGLSVAGVCRLCMVEIEGNAKLQIACNTQAQNGMVINNTSEKVKEAVKWGLDFHLINHPLDCPVCDQAGECGLQDQYMQYGQYDSQMNEHKVKKHKVIDLGKRVVLDSERCILCSRCVRFTDEVTKTHELRIFKRGDHSEIGTFENQPLNNNYSVNTVDICPVGALTAKDFRFRQRVWFLKSRPSLCQGCSTGCNVSLYYNNQGIFRVKPRPNQKVNGWWMCDKGRDIYKFVNAETRLAQAFIRREENWEVSCVSRATEEIAELLKKVIPKEGKKSIALVLTAQYSIEEYEFVLKTFAHQFNKEHVYYWINNKEQFDDFDGLLLRGDRNPNSKGLVQALEQHQMKSKWSGLVEAIGSGEIKTVIVAGPENQDVYPDFKDKVSQLAKADRLIWMSTNKSESFDSLTFKSHSYENANGKKFGSVYLLPMKSFYEKSGSYMNYNGLVQRADPVVQVVPKALTLSQALARVLGVDESEMDVKTVQDLSAQVKNETLINNEFTYRSGNIGEPIG